MRIVKNYFRATLIEKFCLEPETNFFSSSKALCDWIEEELLPTLFISVINVLTSKSF